MNEKELKIKTVYDEDMAKESRLRIKEAKRRKAVKRLEILYWRTNERTEDKTALNAYITSIIGTE